jgi:hypothetical protein
VKHGAETQPDRVPNPPSGHVEDPAVDADSGPHPQVGKLGLPRAWHLDRANLRRSGEPVIGDVQELPGSVEANGGMKHDLSEAVAPTLKDEGRGRWA